MNFIFWLIFLLIPLNNLIKMNRKDPRNQIQYMITSIFRINMSKTDDKKYKL